MSHGPARSSRRILGALLAIVLAVPWIAPTVAPGVAANTTMRVSLTNDGEEADDRSKQPSLSTDGRYVAFTSYATNLVPDDENDAEDIFVRDRDAGTTSIVTVNSDEEPANDYSGNPVISGNGRYVVFWSQASNLVEGDTNDERDIFVRDLVDGTTERVSVSSDEVESDGMSTMPSISDDGRYVAFASEATNLVANDTNDVQDVFVRDLVSGSTIRASLGEFNVQATSICDGPVISGNGLYVVFHSSSPNLVSGDTNTMPDVFCRTIGSEITERINLDSDENQATGGSSEGAWISQDGSYVTFNSAATNLVSGDTNGFWDVFVRDRSTGMTERVNVSSTEAQVTEMPYYGYNIESHVSDDGRYVVFRSNASTLVEGDTNTVEDIFVRDRVDGVTRRVNQTVFGEEIQGWGSWNQTISGDGRYVAYDTKYGYVVPQDWNNADDVFMVDLVGDPPDPVIAIAGENRYETAVLASQEAYPYGMHPDSDHMGVIATGRNWPDALGGVALAGVLDCPVLLVDTNSVPQIVWDELDRLGIGGVYILGGEAAISAAVEDEFIDYYGDSSVFRLAGTDRYKTAEAVAAKVIELQGEDYDGNAFVATGANFPDALAAAPLAAANGWPLFLTKPTGLTDTTKAAMGDVLTVLLLGGTAAVPQVTEDYLVGELGAGDVERLQGSDRYGTAVQVATYGVGLAGLEWDRVGITTGEKFPDALAGGVLQGKVGSVMLLTKSLSLSPATAGALAAHKADIDTVTFFGGTSAVSDTVRTAVEQALQ